MKLNTRIWDELIYDDCARGLYCPDEAEAEAMGTLPPEKHTAEEYDAPEVLDLLAGMAENLKKIFQRGETLNRFSSEYADLCPQMMEVVRLAACALSTLYVNGEDVNDAAVSIYELRRLASFHFRKCQAAARVAAERNETVCVRTTGLALQWMKLLLRLKQTEIRFTRPLPQPRNAAVVVHASVKPLQLETAASAAESSRTLPQARAIHAALPFRAQRPSSPSSAVSMTLPETQAAAEPTPEPDAETLRLLKEYAEIEAYRESLGLRVSRETRLSDLFVPYGMESPEPDSG